MRSFLLTLLVNLFPFSCSLHYTFIYTYALHSLQPHFPPSVTFTLLVLMSMLTLQLDVQVAFQLVQPPGPHLYGGHAVHSCTHSLLPFHISVHGA